MFIRYISQFRLLGVAALFLLSFASGAQAVTVNIDVKSGGKPVSEATVSFETLSGDKIDLADAGDDDTVGKPDKTAETDKSGDADKTDKTDRGDKPAKKTETDKSGPTDTAKTDKPKDEDKSKKRRRAVVVVTQKDGSATGEVDDGRKGEKIVVVVRKGDRVTRKTIVLDGDVVDVTVDLAAGPSDRPRRRPTRTATPSGPAGTGPTDGTPPDMADRLSDRDFELRFFGRAGRFDGAGHPFLALDLGGSLTLGVVRYTPEATETGGGVSFVYTAPGSIADWAGGPVRPFFRFSVFASRLDDSSALGSLDTGAADLGLPGTGDPGAVSPAGFSFPNGGGINDVDDMHGTFKRSAFGGEGAIGAAIPINGMTVSPFIGFGFVGIDQRTTFSGSIPGYATDFAYRTDLDIRRASLSLGTIATVPVVNGESPVGIDFFLQPVLHIDRTSASGTDAFTVSGAANDDQQVSISNSAIRIGGSLGGGIRIKPKDGPVAFDIGVQVTRRADEAVIVRTGQAGDRSRISMNYNTVFSGMLRAVFNY